jgi:hypothetical protein
MGYYEGDFREAAGAVTPDAGGAEIQKAIEKKRLISRESRTGIPPIQRIRDQRRK